MTRSGFRRALLGLLAAAACVAVAAGFTAREGAEDIHIAMVAPLTGPYVFVACMPRTGSTFLTETLCELTGFKRVELTDAYAENEQELDVRRELKDRPMEALALYWLGSAYRHLKQYGRAIECHEEELALRHDLKDRAGEASALHDLGFVYDDEKEYEKAISYYQQELEILRELGDERVDLLADPLVHGRIDLVAARVE